MKPILAISFLLLSSCSSIKMVGTINMISTRNVDGSVDYVLLKSYSGGSKHELKKSKSTTLDEAINNTVKNVAGGEYMMNVKMYLIKERFFAVEGDVWGIASNNTLHGIKVGDRVQWKNSLMPGTPVRYAIVTELKSFETCIVKDEKSGELKEVKFDDLKKAEAK